MPMAWLGRRKSLVIATILGGTALVGGAFSYIRGQWTVEAKEVKKRQAFKELHEGLEGKK